MAQKLVRVILSLSKFVWFCSAALIGGAVRINTYFMDRDHQMEKMSRAIEQIAATQKSAVDANTLKDRDRADWRTRIAVDVEVLKERTTGTERSVKDINSKLERMR